MATNIAPIEGLIELKDNFTGQLGIAQAALGNFSKENQESLKAVAGAAGLVSAAITAVAAATIGLGVHGSDVADVDATLEHFAGSASAAADMMKQLRDGTKGTVDNFALAKDAAHLLSAGVKLTTDDFGILGQASFVLQNRGLGPTKDMLGLVSDALVTGRTRALAMAVGVVDTGDAEARYAARLGTTKEMLSDTGIAEAKRIAVMEILNKAVKDAGNQERDFGEQFEAAQARAVNFYDELSKAVAESPVFAAGMKAVAQAFGQAFGDDNTKLVATTVHWIEQAAIVGVNFGLGAIEMARVVNVAWSAIKVVVLGTETILLGIATTVLGTVEMVTTALAAIPGAPKWVKDTAIAAHEAATNMMEMTKSVASETAEASKGLIGHSAFDRTLDSLSGTLMNVKDAMSAAADAGDKNNKIVDIAVENAKKLSAVSADLNRNLLDRQKVLDVLTKSTQELDKIWDDYFALVAKNSATSGGAQRAQIEATFQKQVDSLNAFDPLYKAKYAAYRATADAALKGIAMDWDSVKDKSIEGLQEQANAALKTYDQMITGGLHFRREVLDAQLEKYRELQSAANGWGTTTKKAVEDVAGAVRILDHAWVTDADVAAATISRTTVMVKTLSGELVTLAEAQRRQRDGGSFEVTTQNFGEAIENFMSTGGRNPTHTGMNGDPWWMAKQGYSYAEILKYLSNKSGGPLPPPQGPRIPGFAEGGLVDIRTGEHGPETVRVPLGSTVYPGMAPTNNSWGGDIHHWHVNGDGLSVARQAKRVLMDDLKRRRRGGF